MVIDHTTTTHFEMLPILVLGRRPAVIWQTGANQSTIRDRLADNDETAKMSRLGLIVAGHEHLERPRQRLVVRR